MQKVDNDTLPIKGTQLSLQCYVDASPKQRQVLWTRDGKILAADGNLEFSTNNLTLVIRHLEVAHDGHYQCVAVNSEGRGTCHSPYDLTVVCK